LTSIKDIAKIVGVSPATVSRVVNGKKYVKAELRERILAVVKETGYVPNNAARSMVLQRTFTIGIVIPDTFNMFQRQLFSAIERKLEGYGYRTRFFLVKGESGSELACLRRLKAEMLDGVILLYEIAQPAFYDFLAKDGMPVVLCTFDKEGYGFAAVHIDEEAAARAATEQLIGLGHRRIGLIGGSQYSFGQKRRRGFRAALSKAGIREDERYIVLAPSYTSAEGRVGMAELLARKLDLSAVFATTDELAVGAIRALYEAGFKVPRDVSIIGFDDIDISINLAPSLSTVHQPIAEMGSKAADLIYGLIMGEAVSKAPCVLPFSVVSRETTRPFAKEAPRARRKERGKTGEGA
jgi:LacI family transcriptional regulator